MRERVLAVIGAICLISAALLVRSWLADRDGDDGDGGDRRSSDELPVVACTPDLVAVCDALADDARIAADPPVLDLDDATEPPDEIDAWITWDPAPRIANFDADRASRPPAWDGSTAIAAGALGAIGTEAAWAEACPGQTTWTCLGAAGIDGTARLGVGAPQTAEGIVRLGPLAQGTAEDPTDPSTLDRNLVAIIEGPPDGQASAGEMATALATRPGGVDIVVGPRSVLDAIAATSQGQRRRLEARTVLNDQPIDIVVSWRTPAGEDLAQLCDGSAIDDDSAAAEALSTAGAPERCPADDAGMTDQLAGFLYQVRRRVG